jgi:hypothetical protein
MTVHRTDIEKSLDELISNEEGMRFQSLAVVLAKQKWRDLIASERKKDLGKDAYAPALLAEDGLGKALACSLTATLPKIKEDLEQIRRHARDLKILIFMTPRQVTQHTAEQWADAIRKAHAVELLIIAREDIITDLMLPSNASVCSSQLGIQVTVEQGLADVLTKTRDAVSEVVTAWLRHSRVSGRPRIALRALKLDEEGRETDEAFDPLGLQAALKQSRRIVLEAPAGRGKTTTLVQIAEHHRDQGDLCFLIDLPSWVSSGRGILEFISMMPAFLSRGIRAEDLARLRETAPHSFLLNGWNEVSDRHSAQAVQALRSLERDFAASGIIVATRSHRIQPPLPGSFRARLLTLTQAQRREYLQQALGNRADELGRQLDRDPVLDDLTRIPLILAEAMTIFLAGRPIPRSRVGVLGNVVGLIERSDEHRDHLERQPLAGRSHDYLAALAITMTTKATVALVDSDARTIVHSVGETLITHQQIARLPEPADVLSALCAHHVLERVEYPAAEFRFQHQQFQEFYATRRLKDELWGLVSQRDSSATRYFAEAYVNNPVWEEALRMLAEEIGQAIIGESEMQAALVAGTRLVEMAVAVDPVFAADLARLCGAKVWAEVRGILSRRLRSGYRLADRHYQQCALAGMLASGSEDFTDIVLPLLTSDDHQVRLNTYRARNEFHLSSLGKDWRQAVQAWKEEHRVDFVSEVMHEQWMVENAEDFALTDPSAKVRLTALSALRWVDATEALARVLNAYDDSRVEEAIQAGVLNNIPGLLKDRVLASYRKLMLKVGDPLERVRISLQLVDSDHECISAAMKQTLGNWPASKPGDGSEWLLKSALEIVQKDHPQWASEWTAEHLIGGSLFGDHWVSLVSSIPAALSSTLLETLSDPRRTSSNRQAIVSVLAATADAALATNAFSHLCKVRADISTTVSTNDNARWSIVEGLADLLRAIPANIAVAGILSRVSISFVAIEYEVVVDIVGVVGLDAPQLKGDLDDELRRRLRGYLKDGLSFALAQDDFNGHVKMTLALALSRVGDPEDCIDLQRLIEADIQRRRRGWAARLSGDRSALANGAPMSCSNWHARALASLDPARADDVLLKVLSEPEYEQDAAITLIQLARIPRAEGGTGYRSPDYRVVWDARAGQRLAVFDEVRRRRYAEAIRQRISYIEAERSKSASPNALNGRLKQLALRLAVLDGGESAHLVMDVMALPGEWDDWIGVDALEALLFSGCDFRADAVLKILNPVIDRTRAQASYDQQAGNLLGRCLCLLAFLDPPSIGMACIRELVPTARLPRHELREVLRAIGESRCDDGLSFLRELATGPATSLQGIATEWIDALASLNAPESKRVLLSFVDPDLTSVGITQHFEPHDLDRLASHIAGIARADSTIGQRLHVLCTTELPVRQRMLLANVLAQLSTRDTLIAALDLVRDDASPSIPHALMRSLEDAFVEHRPYAGTVNAYTLQPRDANEIRQRLFDLLKDPKRRRAALALLGQVESWRLEYGRPVSEPRHPAFGSEILWPPFEFASLEGPTG